MQVQFFVDGKRKYTLELNVSPRVSKHTIWTMEDGKKLNVKEIVYASATCICVDAVELEW